MLCCSNIIATSSRVALIVIGVSLGKSIFQYANTVTQILMTRSVSVEMQKRVFAKMLRNDVAYFVGGHASDLMAKIRLYGTAAGTAFVTMTNRLLTETLTMLALFGVMLYQDAWMTMFCMLILPLILGQDTLAGGFPHSEISGSKSVCRLPEAYRRLQRPSSPLTAKASTVCA